jgi:hypothetical protein
MRIQATPGSEQASVEMVEAGESRHSLSVSTDAVNGRFEVEETQYFPLSGDRASYIHRFDGAEEVLSFLLQMIGTHIACRRTLAAGLA